ncbi:Peptide deformylase [hydrothermal vent metagenome]|uniref:Peptide deformylase n=1 Tax=hydrothermal vent metagenome TaxID=652676 RepID=A0A3B0RCL4_9ZZZZ
MAIRDILTVPNPVLKQVSRPVTQVSDKTRALMDDMLQTMYAAPGIGLAAIQVGVPLRIIVMDLAASDEEPEPRYFINPEILEDVEEQRLWEEGCLSVPDFYEDVERSARVQLRYLDYQGNEVVEWADELYATCIQHEMDHLNGVLFIDHLSRLKRQRAVRKVQKAERDRIIEAAE